MAVPSARRVEFQKSIALAYVRTYVCERTRGRRRLRWYVPFCMQYIERERERECTAIFDFFSFQFSRRRSRLYILLHAWIPSFSLFLFFFSFFFPTRRFYSFMVNKRGITVCFEISKQSFWTSFGSPCCVILVLYNFCEIMRYFIFSVPSV